MSKSNTCSIERIILNVIASMMLAIIILSITHARAETLLERCEKLSLGMNKEKVSGIMGMAVNEGFNGFVTLRETAPCVVRITPKGRLWEIFISQYFDNNVLSQEKFNSILNLRIKDWGLPTYRNYQEHLGFASWSTNLDVFKTLQLSVEKDKLLLFTDSMNREMLKADSVKR